MSGASAPRHSRKFRGIGQGSGDSTAAEWQAKGLDGEGRPVWRAAYVAMPVVPPAIATRFRPGQFIAIAVGGPQSGMIGRRSFSIHDVRPDHGGTVEFVFLPREPGAQWLGGCGGGGGPRRGG